MQFVVCSAPLQIFFCTATLQYNMRSTVYPAPTKKLRIRKMLFIDYQYSVNEIRKIAFRELDQEIGRAKS